VTTRFPALAMALALMAAVPGAALAQDAPNRLSLRFGWQPGLELRVTATRTRTRATTESVTRRSTARYTLTVASEGENLRIRFTDPEFETEADADSEIPAEQAKMMDELAGLMPDFIVGRDGAFVGLYDLPGYQKRFGDFLSEIVPPDVDDALLAKMKAMLTSEAFLNARAAEEWNAIVGAWTGADFAIGVPSEYSQNEPLALIPGAEVKMNYAFTAESVSLCRRGGVDRACAELSMRSVADAEDTKRVVEAFLEKLAAGKAPVPMVFRTLEIENQLNVTTEPSGLIPHAYTLTKSIRGTVDTPRGPQALEQTDRTEVRYVSP